MKERIKPILRVFFISLLASICCWIILLFIIMRNSALEPFRYMGF